MTHARQKGSLSRCHSFGRDQTRGWPRGEAMGRAWPERFLKEVGPKKGVGGAKKGQSKEAKEVKGEVDRKHYPLRGRGGTLEDEALSTTVRSTEPRAQAGGKCGKDQSGRACRGKSATKSFNSQPSDSTSTAGQVSSKTTTITKVHHPGLPPALEPRKRRLASLNAEAVNSLLLEKAEVSPATKVAKKSPPDGPAPGGECSPSTEPAAQDSASGKPQTCQSPKQQQQQQQTKKPKPTEKDEIDYCKIFAPTPRRLAGLNAAALLKLTSLSAASKQRVKTDNKSPCTSAGKKVAASTKTLAPVAKEQLKPAGRKAPLAVSPRSGYFSCKKGGFEPSPHWESPVEDPHMAKVGYQSGSVPEYTLKQVKEEQVEAELSPYCCCGPPDTSLDYCCHRLGLFLRQQPAYPEAEEGSFAPVKQECLVPQPPPPSLAHPSIALSAHHPCLCADHCFSSYYVHMAHSRAPPLAALGSRPLTYGPPALCPGPVSGSKLLAPGIAHSSGIPHAPFCTSVRSPCYGEACRVSSYTYRALQPMATRGCSFSTGCSRCRQEIKTEGYSSPRREHSPSLLQVPPALPLSGCPLPQVTTPTAPVPHLLSPLSERRPSEPGMGSVRECPQGSKPSNGALSIRRARLSLKQQAPTTAPSAKQKKVVRRRATNGWRPLGVPVEKEVFVVGEDEPALRQCFEGVQRDGEEIRVRDTVLLRSGPRKKSLPYVAKISALWEDPKTGEVMMSLFWYYRPEHTQGGKDPSMHCENEIFASKHQDVNSVACIEDKCYVLPLAQYCRYCALIKRRTEGVSKGPPLVPCPVDPPTPTPTPPHRRVPPDVDPDLVYLCRHVYDFRYGRILKNLQ
ncbi:bromo adjacent homology domain-containing 1 protein [Alosa sapidissima]|uniref:bromo adjacent homology domain-containing 1 protein n=1 Tax=Alosa sapidissima TaxID=34773 RepID=UPI001C08DEF3|nr:bromo adjacent homology domain-containing 1 protein [Alosa sapidissima]XP_041950607.1 bromo adjacent homology domain-containing 1 protein [Alosa sapidissima]XP_041950608.1 bromo adjacent homology domain-containing 1 protein [Alosa sapidissima]